MIITTALPKQQLAFLKRHGHSCDKASPQIVSKKIVSMFANTIVFYKTFYDRNYFLSGATNGTSLRG